MKTIAQRIAAELNVRDAQVPATIELIDGGATVPFIATGVRLGLGVADIQSVARELFKFGRDKIGAEQMGAIVVGTPGLRQFS